MVLAAGRLLLVCAALVAASKDEVAGSILTRQASLLKGNGEELMPAQTPADVQGDGLKSTLSPSLHAMVNDLRAHRPDLKDKPDEAVLSLALEAMGAKVGARSSQQPDSAGQEHNDAATGVAGAIDRVASPAAASSSNGAGAAAGTTGVDGSGGASGSGDGGDSAAGMWTIVFIAIASSSATNIGKALQKKATTEVSTLSLRSLASNGLWRIGMATDIGGALLTLHLLSIAPVSVVQPLGGSGSAALALFAHHYLGERLSTTEWTGVAVLILGTTGIGLSDPGAGGHGEEVISTVSALHTLMLLGPAAVITEIVHRRSTAPTAKSKQPGSPALTPNGPLNELAAGFGSGVCFGLSGTLSRIGMVLGKRATATAAASVAVVSAGAASGGAAGGVAGGPGAGLVVVGEEAAAAYSYMYVVAGITASIMVTSLGIFFQTRGMKDGRAVTIVTYSTVGGIITGLIVGIGFLGEPVPSSTFSFALWAFSLGLIGVGVAMLATRKPTSSDAGVISASQMASEASGSKGFGEKSSHVQA